MGKGIVRAAALGHSAWGNIPCARDRTAARAAPLARSALENASCVRRRWPILRGNIVCAQRRPWPVLDGKMHSARGGPGSFCM
eukprot:501610-Pyramimonas_sp.AAC.1